MGFFDDLRSRVESEGNKTINDIQSLIRNRVADAVVKVGQDAGGNLNQQQIDAGRVGSPAALAQSAASAVQSNLVPIAIALGIAFLFFQVKKARK